MRALGSPVFESQKIQSHGADIGVQTLSSHRDDVVRIPETEELTVIASSTRKLLLTMFKCAFEGLTRYIDRNKGCLCMLLQRSTTGEYRIERAASWACAITDVDSQKLVGNVKDLGCLDKKRSEFSLHHESKH